MNRHDLHAGVEGMIDTTPIEPYGSVVELQAGSIITGFEQIVTDVSNTTTDVRDCLIQVTVDGEPIISTESVALRGPGRYRWSFAAPWRVPRTQTYGLRVVGVGYKKRLVHALAKFVDVITGARIGG